MTNTPIAARRSLTNECERLANIRREEDTYRKQHCEHQRYLQRRKRAKPGVRQRWDRRNCHRRNVILDHPITWRQVSEVRVRVCMRGGVRTGILIPVE